MNSDDFKRLANQSANEQRTQEVAETAGKTALYYRLLITNGMSAEAANVCAMHFNAAMVMRQFGHDAETLHISMYMNIGNDSTPSQENAE